MATIQNYYVNTDNTGTADGLTPATGYKNLETCRIQRAANLVSLDQIQVIWTQGVTADTMSPLITGYTTDATHYIQIVTQDSSITGIWNNSVYKVQYGADNAVKIQQPYTRVIGMQIVQTGSGGLQGLNCSTSGCSFSRMIVKNQGGSTGSGMSFTSGSSGQKNYVFNCISYDWNGSAGLQFLGGSDSVCAYFNTVNNCSFGIESQNFSCIARNNICRGNSTDYNGNFSTTYPPLTNGYNTWNPSAPSGQIQVTQTPAQIWVDPTNKNYKVLNTTCQIYGVGTNLSGDSFLPVTTDIINNTRKATPDLGAFEYPAPTGIAHLITGLTRQLMRGLTGIIGD